MCIFGPFRFGANLMVIHIREQTKPADFEYYLNILLVGTVAMVFVPLAPPVLVAPLVFWISFVGYKY